MGSKIDKRMCRHFGHKFPSDSMWGVPYLQIKAIALDGLGHEHAYLHAECERCGESYHVANVHLPRKDRE